MSIKTRLRDLINLSKSHKHKDVPLDLPDHLYRDIGLTRDDVEQLRHNWPSQSSDAPKL